ncbi:amylopullulanase [Paenibacillus macquariensis subsp. defensor]|nr:amylopullulanase [Paenibacillus macquariensis subsp. defensor]
MKIKTIVTTMTVASILSFSLGGPLFAAAKDFADIDKTVGKEKIVSLHDQGIIEGVTATEFRPELKLSNAQGVQLITKALKLNLEAIDFVKIPLASDLFSNINDNAWFAKAFLNAFYNDIDLPKDINPSKPMTKEQFTFFLMQGVEKAGNLPMINIVPANIADETDITSSYQGAIQRSLTWKINTLNSEDKFNPTSEISRAEAAVMLYNAIEFLNERQAQQ